MNMCPNCAAELIPGAKFCHRCGDKVVEKTKQCPACQEANPIASVFCHHCGFHFEGRGKSAPSYQPVYPIDFQHGSVSEQIRAQFFNRLRKRVEEEFDIHRYSEYVERFYHSRFKEIYAVRAEQIAEDVYVQWERFGQEALPEIDRRIGTAFEGLLDYFTIQFCPDLNGVLLPDAILKYERAQPGNTDLWQMIRDFLDFEREEEVFYFDFVTMPAPLLAAACKSYLAADRKEKVFFICDLSIKNTCKEGFALTDRGIYWKAPFDKARMVMYKDLSDIQKGKDWLTINQFFFTANNSLNLKLFKLLKKLRGWTPPVVVHPASGV